ncbi:hypothetical protein B0H14DRAFT_2879468 [Mycena olivaceomarginata]|nr:hypothetical protein B0H14DRAFT_2879468 [Mycena olivaceomarginata]
MSKVGDGMARSPGRLQSPETEFARLFRGASPSVGWSKKIAVAYSGGSDSTCLLFLIHRYLQDLRKETAKSRPSSILSKKPRPGEAFEGIGRQARYHLLFQAMKQAGAEVLALGHHGDDQVETSLIRLSKGTTELGAGGMRKVRRWGMGVNNNGDENTVGWAGVEGMTSWMVRPLLEVSKERILATCEENNLEYIDDSTNFQPELTIRNAIRHLLSKNTLDPQVRFCFYLGFIDADGTSQLGLNYLLTFARSMEQLQVGLSSLTIRLEQLRSSVNVLNEQVEDVETLVDSCLNRCHLPSPPSTYLVSYRGLSTIQTPSSSEPLFSASCVMSHSMLGEACALTLIVGGRAWNSRQQVESGETIGWIACRQPPLKRTWMEDGGRGKPLWVDITDEVVAKLRTKHESRGQKLAGDRLMVHPQTRWYLPVVMHSQAKLGVERIVHNTLSTSNQGLVPLDRDTIASWRSYTTIEAVTSRWIEITWVRSLSGL